MNKLRLSLIAVAVLATFPLQSVSAGYVDDGKDAYLTDSRPGDVDVTGAHDFGILAEGKELDFSGKNINVNITAGPSDNWGTRGVFANNQGTMNLGSANTESIVIKVSDDKNQGNNPVIGLGAREKSVVVVTTKNLEINTYSENGIAYGVLSAGIGHEPQATLTINAENTVINASSGIGNSQGLVALSQGILTVNGNLTVNADDAIAARGDAKVRVNEGGTNTVVLNGDINFNYDKATSGTKVDADVLVNLTGSSSQWTGNVKTSYGSGATPDELSKVTGLQLVVADEAKWNATVVTAVSEGDTGTTPIALNQLTLENGIVNIEGATDQVVEVETLKGSGGTINTVATTDGSTVSSGQLKVTQSVDGTPHLTVNAVGLNADAIDDPEKAMQSFYDSALAFNDDSNVTATMNIAEGDVSGALVAQVTDGIATTTETANTVNSSLIDIASSNYLFFRSQINDVSARLGDLRSMPKTAGAWVRYYGGQNKYSAKDMKEKYNTLQIGADKFINDNFYLGGTFSYTKGDGTLANGSTDDKNFNFGIYGGWMGEKGQFVDVIIKRHRLKSDFDLYSGNGVSSGNFHNWATSASVEAGWRFNCPSNGFYAEPQVEFQLGHVDSANYTTSRGVKVKQDGIDSVIGRAGVAVGYSFPESKGNAYAMASVLHDWKGEVKSTFGKDGQSRTYSEDLGGTWGEFALGGTYNPTKNVSAYGQFKTSTGSPVRNPWQVSVGLRYNF